MFAIQKFVCATNGTTTVYSAVLSLRVFSVEPTGCATITHRLPVPVILPDRIELA